mgnify:CR=1 FL=1
MTQYKHRPCIECGHIRNVDWQGVCTPCADALDAETILQPAEVADNGQVIRQVSLSGCEQRATKQLHLLDQN